MKTIRCDACGGSGVRPSVDGVRRLFRALRQPQSRVARQIGVTPQYFNDVLHGRRPPTLKLWRALRKAG